jgi:hypothetical protein
MYCCWNVLLVDEVFHLKPAFKGSLFEDIFILNIIYYKQPIWRYITKYNILLREEGGLESSMILLKGRSHYHETMQSRKTTGLVLYLNYINYVTILYLMVAATARFADVVLPQLL